MKYKKNLKVSVSGVRGIIGESLTPGLITSFAASFGRYVGPGKVVVGRDTRPSGEMVEHAVVAGLLAVGCQPMLIGIVPTPTVQIAVKHYNACGGIAITASHNPVQWNALKFIGPSSLFLDRIEAAELLDIYNQPDIGFSDENSFRSIQRKNDAFAIHQKKIFDNIDVEAIRDAGFKVAVDCCCGVGALYSRKFLEELGCEVFTVYDQPTGIFERGPEPIAENLVKLSETVKQNKCLVGFAQDPDGDRLALVNSQGEAVGEQYSLVMAVDHILSEMPGDVVVNVQTTKAVEDVAASYGCSVEYSRVGEINVTGRMLETGAEIGGEGSCGGVIWSKVHPCRDSFVTMALILEMMALSGEKFDEILESLPAYVTRSLKFPCPAARANEIVRFLKHKYSDCELYTIDGIRINFPDSWVLVRPSNTETVIRLSAEARSAEKADELMKNFSEDILKLADKA